VTDPADLRRTPPDEFEPPDEELIREVLLRTGDLQHRRVFFDALENPLWVAPLAEREAFIAPELVIGDDGTLRSPPWPEGDYLARVADRVPEDVARVLSQHTRTENVFVQRTILKAAARMPAEIAARLSDDIATFFLRPYRSWLDPADVVALIRNLAEGGQGQKALRLAQNVYRPRAAEFAADTSSGREATRLGRQDVVTGLENYWHRHTLPEVVTALATLGASALPSFVAWLESYQTVSGSFDSKSRRDISYMWRPSISLHEQNYEFEEVGNALVDAVRNLALTRLADGQPLAEVLLVLERSDQPLLRRIALDVLATYLADTETPEALAAATARVLRRDLLAAEEVRHEYALLARTTLLRVDATLQQRWGDLLESEPGDSDHDLRPRLAADDQAPEEVDDSKLIRFREIWRLRLLAAIGRPALPPAVRARFDELTATYGVPEHPEFPTYHTSFVGPAGPLAPEAIAEMSVGQLLEHLRTWQPDRSEVFGPSVWGQAEQLADYVKAAPGPLAERAADLTSLPISYITAVLRGFEGALTEQRSFPWRQVLELAQYVAVQADDGREVVGRLEDGEAVWRSAQQQVASLLTRAITVRGVGLAPEHAAMALQVLAPLTSHPDPTPEHEERYGGSNMDPLTLSLNTVRPVAIRAVAKHLDWHVRLLEDGNVAEAIRTELASLRETGLSLLDARLGPEADPSLAVAAVFGEVFGSLLRVDRAWTLSRLPRLLGPADVHDVLDDPHQAYADVVWSVLLAMYHPSLALLEPLRGYFTRALVELGQDRPLTVGWRTQRGPRERLADHLLMLHVLGVLRRDDELMQVLFASAPIALRADALGHLGFAFLHAAAVPEEVLDRARALWEWRAAEADAGRTEPTELDGFYWWVRSGRFDAAWWLPFLIQAAASPTFDPHGMVAEALAEAARPHPGLALAALEQLLGRPSDPWRRYDLVRHAPQVLAAALDSADPQLVQHAMELMDMLGREGHVDLDQSVQEHRLRRSL
jgi:hypothetical protein